MSELRLNHYLSKAGICSRREADRLIEQGRVLINGVPASVGAKVDGTEEILCDGVRVKAMPEKVVLAVNKPVGVVCTTAQFPNEVSIIDLVNYPQRVFPVGRLDKASRGLILLTNDGDLAEEISRGANRHEKEYLVSVNKEITLEFLEKMRSGVEILDTVTRPCKVTKKTPTSFDIILTQGLNRQIRRMCEALDYRVTSLQRIRVMNITLDGLQEGKWRRLSQAEVDGLMKHAQERGGEPGSDRAPKSGAKGKYYGNKRKT